MAAKKPKTKTNRPEYLLLKRSAVEEILDQQYNIKLAGSWRWLHEKGILDIDNPSEDIDLYILYDEYRNNTSKDMSKRSMESIEEKESLKVEALLRAICHCWTVATFSRHPSLKILSLLKKHEESIYKIWDDLYGIDGVHNEMYTRLHPSDKEGANESYTLYPRERELYSISHKMRSGLSLFLVGLEDFFAMSHYIVNELVAPELYINQKYYLRDAVSSFLADRGFKIAEVKDILAGPETYRRDFVGEKEVLSLEGESAQNRIRQRISRHKRLKREYQTRDTKK